MASRLKYQRDFTGDALEGNFMTPPSRHLTESRLASVIVRMCNWYHPAAALGAVWRLAARGYRPRLRVWHLIAVVALAAVAVWAHIERRYYLAWSREAWMERSLLDQAAARDADAAAAEKKARAGLPFVPRTGFMPYGPTPVGGHDPQSWWEERTFQSEQARLLRSKAEPYGRRKQLIAARSWWLPG
jgi:hypothetical protein